jgi:hypothetical protein
VFWQEEGAGDLSADSEVGAEGDEATLPADLVLRDGETVIVAEVVFRYERWLLRVIPDTTLRRVAYYRPRLGTLRSLD